MSTPEMLAQLKEHVDKLHALLKAPEPGLITWNMFVGQEWKAIASLWEGPPEEAQTTEVA